MKFPFLISLGAHFLLFFMVLFGDRFSFFSFPKEPPVMIPVEFVVIAKESQGAISKPQIIEKEAEKEEQKSDPKAEEKPLDEKPKPIPQKAKKEEEVKEKEVKKDKKPAPVPDGIPDKKKKKIEKPKEDKKEDKPKKDLPKKDKKPDPKKKSEKGDADDEFEQILKNLDTSPVPKSKDDQKTQNKGKKKNVTNKLSEEATMSLIDAMKAQVTACWKFDAGVKGISEMVVPIHIKLKIDGSVESAQIMDEARMSSDVFYRSFAQNAQRAVYECAPYNLPPDMYDQENGWKEMELNFDPREMLDQVQ